MKEKIENLLIQSSNAIRLHSEKNSQIIAEMAKKIINSIKNGGKLIIFGNGGSAADSQHLAAELVGSYLIRERSPIPAVALSVNTSILTAVANDFGYDEIFTKQIQAIGKKGDIVLGISTSGNSPNVNKALVCAGEIGLTTLGFSGKGGGKMVELCDLIMIVPSDFTPNIQEAHIASGHIICGLIEEGLK